jgi:hypothetical protein
MGTGVLSPVYNGRGLKLNTDLHLAPRLRMSGPLPLLNLPAFMVQRANLPLFFALKISSCNAALGYKGCGRETLAIDWFLILHFLTQDTELSSCADFTFNLITIILSKGLIFTRYAEAQLVGALRYKPEVRGIDSRWGLKPLGRTVAIGSY